ncbi:MAG: sigma-70 family RNA polymerase sigma factor [Planctomycetes bacterium]|nr:sigma-70 family RNA polymerase sigma factor [Planctomycetota bacterium]
MAEANIHQKSDALSSVDRVGEVFDEYGDFIRSIIRFHIRNEAEAEDLFQDLFLSLIVKPIPEEVQNVKGFLYKIIYDTVKDSYRRIDRYQARIRKYSKRNLHIVKNHPESSLIDVEETKKMFDLIKRHLPTQEALAVTLRYRDDCDTGEVAEIMGVKPRSVSSYVSTGLKKIGHAFGKKAREQL